MRGRGCLMVPEGRGPGTGPGQAVGVASRRAAGRGWRSGLGPVLGEGIRTCRLL